ncbi:MAG: hypothetical protein Q8K97_17050 [Pseudohongiella sp.]|nr:hypothetical protein [Pseudohongiella sp.]
MKSGRILAYAFITALGLNVSAQSHATPTPGTPVGQSQITQNVAKLFDLAQQVFPELFSGAGDWHLFEGFYYKYFANTGTYIGIKESNVYLMGGPFGGEPISHGPIADALTMLEGALADSSEPFRNVAKALNVGDLISYFAEVTLEYGAGGNIPKVTIALELLGQEAIDGAASDKVKVTISGGSLSAPQSVLLWVNAEGIITRYDQNGFVVGMPQSNTFGTGIISGMLIALAAADSPIVKAAIDEQLSSNEAVTQNMGTGSISGVPVKTLSIQVGATGGPKITGELSDFGSFSMLTSLQSQLGFSATSFEIKHVVLR